MKRARQAVLLLALIPATVRVSAQLPSTISDFFDRFTAEWVRQSPNQAASTRYFSGAEQQAFERQLTPQTDAWAAGRRDLARRGLAELATFDRARLNKTDRLSAELMQWQLQMVVDGERFEDYAFPFNQFDGVNVGLPNTFTVVHPLRSDQDAENYMARLEQVAARVDESIGVGRRIAAKKLIPPRFILNRTIDQMRQFISMPPAANPIVTTVSEKLGLVEAMPAARRDAFRARAERIVGEQVYPAWRRAIAFLEPLVPTVNDDAGLWRLPGGAEAYAFNLRRYTTTDLTADQIHDIGLKQVARIEGEMDALFRQIGRSQGSVKERIAQLKKDQAYPLTEDGQPRSWRRSSASCAMLNDDRRCCSTIGRPPRSSRSPFPGSARQMPPPTTRHRRQTVRGLASSRFRCVPSG